MLYFHVCQSHSFVITFPLRIFATMKKSLSLIIAVVCISTTTVQAQFYTVGNSKHHYKVKVHTPYIEKETPQFRDASSINMLPTDSATSESKTPEQQNASNFCYPLHSRASTSPLRLATVKTHSLPKVSSTMALTSVPTTSCVMPCSMASWSASVSTSVLAISLPYVLATTPSVIAIFPK